MRPTTQRPYTAISTTQSHREASYVVAVIEERGISREVGIAAIDRDTGKTVLIQVTDCPTYVKTLHHIHLHTPSLILVPDSHFSSSKTRSGQSNAILIELLQEEFMPVPIEPVPKKYWSETAGLEFLHQLCIDEDRTALLVSASDKYYVLNAVAALFKYLETKQSTVFAARSLRIIYRPIEGTMMIDTASAKHLELIESMSKKKQNRHSLFGVLNFTYTPMGNRLLRVNLLSPITVLSSIDARLDAVEELVQNEDIYSALKDGLRALNKVDMDKVIVGLSSSNPEKCTTNSFKSASLRITQLLNVRNIVRSLPSLQHCLQGSRCQLLQAIFAMLSDERIGKIEKIVSDNLNDMIKQKGLAATHARVYAVKANISHLLDVARETYRENVADIYSFCQELAEEYELPLKLKYSELHGYSFMLPKEHGEKLPQGFINITSKGDKWYFSKVDLKKKNARMRDSLDEALILSDRIVQELLDHVIQEIGVLYKASEATALLDMLWSFAHVAILRNYVRPEFTGTLAIKAGRHPIMDRHHSPAGVLIPNDVYSSESSCFQLIQGPNMSGKSSYLRQVALLTILAMCGSFVPAEYASFRVHDTLLTRLSNDDDMARNLSTFASEMASAVMILSLANAHSLILLDELGRGTSSHEGMGMSHAIAEELIRRKSFVFFATHFRELSVTLSRYPSVVNLHLSVQKTTRGGSSSIGMIFKYKLVDGVPEEGEHYGIALAKLADLPKSLLDEAELVAKKLQGLQERGNERSCHEKVRARRKMLLTLRDQLCQAFRYGRLSEENLLSYLQNLQCTAVGVLSRTMDDENTSATLRN